MTYTYINVCDCCISCFFKYKDPFLSLIVGTVGQAVYIYSKWRNLKYKKRKASQKMETFASIYEWDIRILAQ